MKDSLVSNNESACVIECPISIVPCQGYVPVVTRRSIEADSLSAPRRSIGVRRAHVITKRRRLGVAAVDPVCQLWAPKSRLPCRKCIYPAAATAG